MKYHISLFSYAPREEKIKSEGEETIIFQRGDIIGGRSVYTSDITIEQAIERARDMWKDWVSENKGTQIEVWIHEYDYPPKVGPTGSIFHKSNFDAFRPGSKQQMGTPF